jgi:ABC-type dipeptide/oligopeptide/nickel transport system permease component
MLGVATRRTLGALGSILLASLAAFLLLRALPGNPAQLIVGEFASEEAVRAQEDAMGLNDPLYVQYWLYISDFVQGDWGFLYSVGHSVRTEIGARLPASLELGIYAFVVAFLAAVGLALWATYRRNKYVDAGVRSAAYISLGTPPFWFGLLLLLVFYVKLGWLPGPEGQLGPGTDPPPVRTHFVTVDALIARDWSAAADAYRHLVLPVVTLALIPFAYLVRILRASMLEVGSERYMIVARSKGLSRWKAVRRHALPNAFLPTLTASGIIFVHLLTGAVLVETVFRWPGLGASTVESIQRKDFALVQTVILLSACAYVAINLLVDVMYGVIDPRVRLGPVGKTQA